MNHEIQELELQERNFILWYGFMRDTQLNRINQYLSNNIANTEEEVGQCEQFVQQLNEVQNLFEQLKQEQEDNVNNIEYTIEDKRDKMHDLVNALNEARDKVQQIVENFDEKAKQRQVLFQQFESENNLIELNELPSQDFKELFKLFNYVFFDNIELQWPKFQQTAFGKEIVNPVNSQSLQQQVQQQVGQMKVETLNQAKQLLQIPEKEEEHDQEKEVLNSEQNEQNEQEIPFSKNLSNQEQKQQQNKQQIKKSQFKQKMIHLKVEDLSDVKRDKLQKYFIQENKNKVSDSEAYKQNQLGFKNLFDWLDNFHQIDELQKERLNAQSELKKIQKEYDETKKQYNIEFDEATLKFYKQGMEESESMQEYVEQSLAILDKLSNTFEGSKQFFEDEGYNMQNILNALQGQMEIPKEIYKKVEKTK